jgi:hypothetical protein
VCVVNKLLKIFNSDLGSEGRTSQVLEETIKVIRPKTNDDILLSGILHSDAGIKRPAPVRSPKG